MHELSITRSALAVALDEAGKHGAKRIMAVTLCIGTYSGAVPACVEEYFAIVSKGTAAEDAKLIIETPDPRVACNACGYEGETKPFYALCPRCGSDGIRLVSGREFYVDSIEVE